MYVSRSLGKRRVLRESPGQDNLGKQITLAGRTFLLQQVAEAFTSSMTHHWKRKVINTISKGFRLMA